MKAAKARKRLPRAHRARQFIDFAQQGDGYAVRLCGAARPIVIALGLSRDDAADRAQTEAAERGVPLAADI